MAPPSLPVGKVPYNAIPLLDGEQALSVAVHTIPVADHALSVVYQQRTGTLSPTDLSLLLGLNQASLSFSETETCVNFHRTWPRVHHDQTP